MGRSRKKTSGSQGGFSEQELRRYVLMLAVPFLLLLLVIIVLVSGGIRDLREQKQSAGAAGSSIEEQAPDSGDLDTIDGSGKEAGDVSPEPGETEAVGELEIEPDTKEYIQDFGGSILTQDGAPEINQLMEQYFMSISDCDMATFLHLFTSQDTSEEEFYRKEFEQQKQYIDGYQNISCYTTPGMQGEDLAAYVYYEIRYTGVETPAPGLVRIYAVRGEDGQYRIYDQELSPELSAFLEQLSMNEDVRLLSTQVDQRMEAAMEADPALKERVEFMKRGASYMQEESAESPVSGENGQ